METRERQAARARKTAEESPRAAPAAGTQARADKLRKGMETLINEIDEALVENAEEFVANFVQRGGE